jgi:hypothetical protein
MRSKNQYKKGIKYVDWYQLIKKDQLLIWITDMILHVISNHGLIKLKFFARSDILAS